MQKQRDVRIGFVSSVDYAAGTVEVTYPDMDGSVSDALPLLSAFADEYFMPEPGDQVLVNHLSNGSEYGVVVGRTWDKDHKPTESGKGLFRKDFDRTGAAFLRYDANSGELRIKAKKIVFEGDESVTTNTKTVTTTASSAATLTSPAITDNGAVTVSQSITAAADVSAGGKSLMKHTHAGVHGETSTPN